MLLWCYSFGVFNGTFAIARDGDYVKACGTLVINEWAEKVSLREGYDETELLGLSTAAYSNGMNICVSGYEGRSFSGKKTISVMLADSE